METFLGCIKALKNILQTVEFLQTHIQCEEMFKHSSALLSAVEKGP